MRDEPSMPKPSPMWEPRNSLATRTCLHNGPPASAGGQSQQKTYKPGRFGWGWGWRGIAVNNPSGELTQASHATPASTFEPELSQIRGHRPPDMFLLPLSSTALVTGWGQALPCDGCFQHGKEPATAPAGSTTMVPCSPGSLK